MRISTACACDNKVLSRTVLNKRAIADGASRTATKAALVAPLDQAKSLNILVILCHWSMRRCGALGAIFLRYGLRSYARSVRKRRTAESHRSRAPRGAA